MVAIVAGAFQMPFVSSGLDLDDAAALHMGLPSEGVCVRPADGSCVWFSPDAVAASAVLRVLAAEELAEGPAPVAPAVQLAVPVPPLCSQGCALAHCGLQQAASAFQPGGFPLALRWDVGDVEGLARAVAVFICAQFLDAPLLAKAARDEFAVALAMRCGDAAEVAALFEVGPKDDKQIVGGKRPLEQSKVEQHLDVQDLVARAPALGERGRQFAEVWACGRSPLAGLPEECIRDVLQRADAWVRGDPGVCELLCSIGRGEPGAQAITVEEDALSGLCHAIDIISARSHRYRGSSLILAGLSMLAAAERNPPELRLRAVGALARVARPGDLRVAQTLHEVILASRDSGGALFEGKAITVTDQSAELHIESPVAAAARRMQLDAAWQVRVAACAALVDVAEVGSTDAVQVLCTAVGHGYFEVRVAATRALGRIAHAGDREAASALVAALSDDDWRVRETAVVALTHLVLGAAQERGPGPQDTGDLIPAICDQLGHRSADVRQSARAVLQRLIAEGDRLRTACVVLLGLTHAAPGRRVPLLRRPMPEVRCAAVEVLGDALGELSAAWAADLSEPREGWLEEAIAVGLTQATRALMDRNAVVRHAAALTLGGFRGDRTLPAIWRERIARAALDTIALLKKAPGVSPEEALEVLRANAVRGNHAAVAVVMDALQQRGALAGVRRTAAAALTSLVHPGDLTAVNALLGALHETDASVWDELFRGVEAIANGEAFEVEAVTGIALDEAAPIPLRCRALLCLARVARSGNVQAMHCAIVTLGSSDPRLRAEALGLVQRVAEPGDTAAKALVAARLGDCDAEVCKRAMDACESIAGNDDTHMIEALIEHIVGGEFCLRQMAVRTLQRVARQGHPSMLSKLLPWAEQGHWPQRQAALEALAVLAPRGDQTAVAMLMQRASDSDGTCRQTACEVLGHVAAPGDEAAILVLIDRLEDSNWLVRDAAGTALAKVVTRKHIPALEKLVERVAEDARCVAEDALRAARNG